MKKRAHVAVEDIKALAFLLQGPCQVCKLVAIQNWSESTLQYAKNGGPIQIPTGACAFVSFSFLQIYVVGFNSDLRDVVLHLHYLSWNSDNSLHMVQQK